MYAKSFGSYPDGKVPGLNITTFVGVIYISLLIVVSKDEWHKLFNTDSLITSSGISGFSILLDPSITAE